MKYKLPFKRETFDNINFVVIRKSKFLIQNLQLFPFYPTKECCSCNVTLFHEITSIYLPPPTVLIGNHFQSAKTSNSKVTSRKTTFPDTKYYKFKPAY